MSVPPLDRRPVILEAGRADPDVTGHYRCRMRRIARITPITGWM
ncbi:MAG TPA: hypothetical protein VHO07_21130 [Streptosporangiaceae bacterium]|jgi:hypothetical protein|nr:hypothetical protein [Streptosporangiaceae bacterium]